MHSQRARLLSVLAVSAGATAFAATSAAAGSVLRLALDLPIPAADAWTTFGQLYDVAYNWAVDGFANAPIIMLGLALVAGVPVLAVMGWLLVPRAAAMTLSAMRSRPGGRIPHRARDAHVRVDGTSASYRIARELVRIGREADNDLCLSHATVESYHALIRCTPERDYIIVDLSAMRGRSVKVNGSAVAESHLRDGDSIEIGEQLLRFEARPIAKATHID